MRLTSAWKANDSAFSGGGARTEAFLFAFSSSELAKTLAER
jgi:hypothetical protein